jgi:hypothetical protein
MGTRDRTGFEALSPEVHAAIEAAEGPVLDATPVGSGLNSGIAVVLRTRCSQVFVKGLPHDHPRIATQHREAAIAQHVAGIGPDLRWQLDVGGWNLLGFEHLAGHRADFAPGSPDLSPFAAVLTRLGNVATPDLPLTRIEQRWSGLTDEADVALLAGNQLLHTDLNPHNILIGADDAWIVDWAWPALGAAWIDPACATLWLIAEGNTPASAEIWANQIPAWHDAPAEGIDMFATINTCLWTRIADDDPQPWKQRMRDAAQAWKAHRAMIMRGGVNR